jgi:hypothetical protein
MVQNDPAGTLEVPLCDHISDVYWSSSDACTELSQDMEKSLLIFESLA